MLKGFMIFRILTFFVCLSLTLSFTFSHDGHGDHAIDIGDVSDTLNKVKRGPAIVGPRITKSIDPNNSNEFVLTVESLGRYGYSKKVLNSNFVKEYNLQQDKPTEVKIESEEELNKFKENLRKFHEDLADKKKL